MHNKCMKQNKDLLNIQKLLNYMNNTWHKNIFKVKKNKIKYFYYKYIINIYSIETDESVNQNEL